MKKTSRNKIQTVKSKLFLLCKTMIVGVIVTFLMIELSEQFIISSQNNILENYESFSNYINEMKKTETLLNSYMILPTKDLGDKYQKSIQHLKDIAAQLQKNIREPMMEDIANIIDTYGTEAENLIQLESKIGLNPEFLESGEKLNSLTELLKDLMDNHYRCLNQYIHTQLNHLKKIHLFLNIAILLILTAAMVYLFVYILDISTEISIPLEKLTQRARSTVFDAPDLEEPEKTEQKNELDVLTDAFNEMLVRNHEYIAQLKEKSQLEKKLAEEKIAFASLQSRLNATRLKVLQARINPHFTFNILNVISGLAIDEDAEKTADMIVRTAEYFRYSLVNLDKVVRLKEEFQNIRDYFTIQKLRYDDRLQTEILLDERCADALICSMVLQPFCENALAHGIAPLIEGGTIKVASTLEDTAVCLEISDNGIGITKERLTELRQWIKHYEDFDDSHGVGIVNTYYRLVLFFGDAVSVTIDSEWQQGTKITLRFPLWKERDLL